MQDPPPSASPAANPPNTTPTNTTSDDSLRRLETFSWVAVLYNLGVILWGAWVRITGSGAGCGDHWPMCNGEVVPPSPSEKTVIEFAHRLSSGLCLPIAIVLIVWIRRRFPAGHRARTGAYISTLFLLLEAALGALLVKFKLVADDESSARAVVIALHLVNTLTLIGFGALTAWWVGGGSALRWRAAGSARWLWLTAMIGLVIVCMAGAVTALGDTLFPVDAHGMDGLLERLWSDLSPTEHFLVRLRILHPTLAVALGLFLLMWTSNLRWKPLSPQAHQWASRVTILVLAEVALGALNVWLAAPGWMQLAHLAAANLLWISVVLLGACLMSDPPQRSIDNLHPHV